MTTSHDTSASTLIERIASDEVIDQAYAWLCARREEYSHNSDCHDGVYRDVMRGVSLRCPLSPLMGALYLLPLDQAMAEAGLFYARFMDDWVVLASSRWRLRRAVAVVNRVLNGLKVEKHPDKTFIGRAPRGFDFLGYRLSPGRLVVAAATIARRHERMARLYEQGADPIRVGQYVRKWLAWARAGTPLDVAMPRRRRAKH